MSFVWFVLVLLSASKLGEVGAVLYENNTDIKLMDANTVDKVLLETDAKNIWLTQFYAHWCGTCQNFVPKWLKVVDHVKKWSPIAKVAALDCGNPDNVDACRRYNVSGYPTVRLYWPAVLHRQAHDFGFLAPLTVPEILSGMSEAVISIVNNATYQQLLPPASHYLFPSSLDESTIWDVAKPCKQSFIIVEYEQPDFKTLGSIIALDTALLNEEGELNVRFSLFPNSENSNVREKLASVLHMKSIPRNLELPVLIELDMERRRVIKIIRTGRESITKFFFSLILELTEPPVAKAAQLGSASYSSWLPEDDLYGAVSYMIINEVSLTAMISSSKLANLKNLFEAIIRYVPFHSVSIKQSIQHLIDVINEMDTTTEMSAHDWLLHVKDSKLPKVKPWVHCKGSKPQFRGYPCSLWLLFHTVSSNAASDITTSDEISVIPAIRNYVNDFFGCRECAQHFVNATIPYSNAPNRDAHIVIWRAHNKANKRLSGAISEDPQAPKIQFPSETGCPKCLNSDGSWDEKAIGEYLKNHYSKENIIPMESEESVKEEEVSASLSSLSTVIFVLFVFLVIGLLISSRILCSVFSSILQCLGLEKFLHKEDLLPRFIVPQSRMKQV